MRVTLKIVSQTNERCLPLRSSLDLYHSKQVEQLTQKMAGCLEIGSSESEKTISEMTSALENYRQEKLEQLKPKQQENRVMSEAKRKLQLSI